MGTTYASPDSVRVGRSLFLATASYESVKPGFAYSLAMTTAELERHHIPFEIAIMEGNCHVDDGRNSLVRRFLSGNCTDMLFLDSDLMWSSNDVIRMLTHTDPLVCGAYPKKCDPTRYPIGRIFHTRPDGMLEVSYAPTGFMRIQRGVFERLLPLQSKHGRERPTAVFFERRFNGPSRDGGDVTFCRKWIAAGGKVVVDPHIVFSHIGEHRWTGRFLSYLSDDQNRARHFGEPADRGVVEDNPRTFVSECGKDGPEIFVPVAENESVPYWITRLRAGDASGQVFDGLATAYGNKPWAAPTGFLELAHRMAAHLPQDATILECGSGLSTVVLALSGRKVVALEENLDWAEKTQALLTECELDAEIIVAPMNGTWYAAKDAVKGLGAKMALIDGPRRREGINRLWPILREAKAAGVLDSNAAVLMDDTVDVKGSDGAWVQCGSAERPFCAGRLGRSE